MNKTQFDLMLDIEVKIADARCDLSKLRSKLLDWLVQIPDGSGKNPMPDEILSRREILKDCHNFLDSAASSLDQPHDKYVGHFEKWMCKK